jgi:hypothetical protein
MNKVEKTNTCPCPKIECPVHEDCANCTSRHLRLGFLNYCGFYSILPFLKEVIESSPDSLSALKFQSKIRKQSEAYLTLMGKNNITEEELIELRIKKSNLSSY